MRRKHALFWALLVLLVLGVVEAAAALTTHVLTRRSWMAYVPDFTPGQASRYFARRDPWLGWGAATDRQGRVVRLEPRPDPAFSARQPPCVSAYGDSFTEGGEAPDDGSYPHHLGVRLGCGVANYGRGGYGSDQALMLFRAQAHLDRAPVLVLGHLSENILRNVNQYRNLLYPGNELLFKPRLLRSGDGLRYVPVPVRTAGDFAALESAPERVLAHDAFVERPRRSFPYTWALARWLATDFHVRSRLSGVPRHAAFYSADHPSGALPLTIRILSAFAEEARGAGRRPYVLLVPVGNDFLHARKTGIWPDQPLADSLRARGVAVIHAGPRMAERIGDGDPCRFIVSSCTSYFCAAPKDRCPECGTHREAA